MSMPRTILRGSTPIILFYYLALPLLAYRVISLWPVEIKVTAPMIPVILILYLAVMAGLTLLGEATHTAILRVWRKRRLERALAALSTSLEALLESSPYAIEYVAGQGEAPRYEVVDTRLRAQGGDLSEAVVACLGDELAAQTWIAERHLAEREQR